MDDPILGLTMGDPAGIGSEVIVKAFAAARDHADLVVVGDADVIREAIALCDSSLAVRPVSSVSAASFAPGTIDVLDLDNVDDLAFGELREEYGRASLEYVERAVDLAVEGSIDGIVTAPINKQATRLAGSTHAGHTGLLADRTGTDDYAMMLIEDDLRVTHVSTHVSLPAACEYVTADRVRSTVEVTADALAELGVDDPRIAVAGLNPHASDGGLLGETEAREIEPAVEAARADGLDVHGPASPDTVFAAAAGGDYDCVVAMYHDQGHIPIKMLGFARDAAVSGVNVTVGLPIVRTSVDHGTAFDIAGDGVASERSMIDAVATAARIARHRRG
ncbi:4-hydroxythreonine-4-phosphate dehydrogenase PdxA [Halobacteriales archaeon QS_1_68_17]|nr:MAG: 4-hydroxythreonine-4-phosphate dehydrogenase PdxA [Halobacteriales archaeon QS_1_68_17]